VLVSVMDDDGRRQVFCGHILAMNEIKPAVCNGSCSRGEMEIALWGPRGRSTSNVANVNCRNDRPLTPLESEYRANARRKEVVPCLL
jgi:hypothetical protein